MKKKQVNFIALFLIILSTNSQSKITNHLNFGEYSVGYKVFHTYDNSRSYFQKYDYYGNRTEHPIGRPMQISIWYPSKLDNKPRNIQYKDYIGFTSSEIDFKKTSDKDKSTSINTFVNSFSKRSKQDQFKPNKISFII